MGDEEAKEGGRSATVLFADVSGSTRLYETAGFTRCGPVLDYPDSKWSVFYEKALAA